MPNATEKFDNRKTEETTEPGKMEVSFIRVILAEQ